MSQKIGIGLAGFGTVGAGVFEALKEQQGLLAKRTGFYFEVRSIVVRDLEKKRDVVAPAALFTNSWQALLQDPAIQIVVELMGGTTDAFDFIKAALRSGKSVVTGNKALLAEHGQEIFALAQECGVPVFYEAAVAGGIPIIQSLRDAFVGNHMESLHGILNGTSNYILSRMQEAGLDYQVALAEATELGYAEADPSLDVNGGDAAHKALVLAALAYGFWIDPTTIRVDGIEKVTAADIQFACDLGYVIKLLGTIRATAEGVIEVSVGPTLIPKQSVLASVKGVFNAIAVKGDLVGEALFYGRGAGRKPTTSSVVGDLVEAAFCLKAPRPHVGFTAHTLYGKSRSSEEVLASYYVRLSVEDRPGVLATIATLLGEAEIGISSVVQPTSINGTETSLVLMTHQAAFGKMTAALEKISGLDCVKSEPVLFCVEAL